MTIQKEQVLLRAYLDSADRAPHPPTCDRLMHAARTAGLAGATVLRGILGSGSRGIIQRSVWSLAQHVPVIVEIVDRAERIVKFLQGPLEQIMVGGMITLERAHVMLYRHGDQHGDLGQPGELALGALLEPLSTLPRIEARGRMRVNETGVLLRVFVGESDRFDGKPLHEAIVHKVRELGLAGATVLRGTEGFGANSVVHKSSLLEMSTDLPVVIEIVDADEKIKRLLPHLEPMVREGMITMEHVVIILYRHDEGAAAG